MVAKYYIVDGWYNDTNGINEGKFYGAVINDDNPRLQFIVLYGNEAIMASNMAKNTTKVKKHELFEDDLISTVQRPIISVQLHELLDNKNYKLWVKNNSIMINADDEDKETITNLFRLDNYEFNLLFGVPSDDSWMLTDINQLLEMFGTGALAIGNYGLPKGVRSNRADNLGHDKIKIGSNFINSKGKSRVNKYKRNLRHK